MSGFKRPERPVLKARPKETSDEQIAAIDAAGAEMGFTVRAESPKEPAKRGRPKKDRTATEARPSFGLDPETHRLFKIWLLRRGLTLQDYLEDHIKELLRSEN